MNRTAARLYWHEHSYRQMNALIPFVCVGEPGFIEPLTTTSAAKVEAGETLVTAVMVVSTPGANAAEVMSGFRRPGDLLGLATGRELACHLV